MKLLLKKLYYLLPFKRQCYTLVKKVISPPQHIYKHLHFNGTITIAIDKFHSFKMMHYGFQLENEIFWKGLTGGWEKESIKLWIKLCSLGNPTVFDVGANTGIYSLIAKSINHDSRVIALEPVHRVFQKLKTNMAINQFNTECLELAASNFTGEAVIYDTGGEHIYSVTVNKNLNAANDLLQVPIATITLDKLITDLNLNKVDLIKIDVETHEEEVLEGMKKYLPIFKPTILIEILNEDIAARVESLVKDNDYLYFNIDEAKGVFRTDSIGRSSSYNYLLCSATTADQIGLDKTLARKSFI